MFPAGLPGLALVLLRVSVAMALLVEDYRHGQQLSGWTQAGAILISIALSVGYSTPIVAAIGLALHALIWFELHGLICCDPGIDSAAVATIVALNAITLALLGPGAYSVDSYRFGRRVVVLPPS
jgi:uncharacterized membrane protein YphA (DoxX/SURF4 family)